MKSKTIMKNIIFNEDCLYTLTERKLNYDYVIFSPPDYDELGMKPIKDDEKYFSWLGNIFSKLKPNNNTITIVVSNRRYNRITIPKHHYITSIMKDLGYDLLNEKIWKKSNEINMYRYNYAFVLCFGSKNYKSKNVKSFQNDIWFHPHKSYNGYTNNFSKDMILRCIENYTDIGETVLDIFMGVGTTAISCIESNRHYLGVEINTEVYESGISRLSAL